MRIFVASFLATIVIAFGAALVLSSIQQPVESRFTSPAGVRI